jgi:hypothetical protein
VNLNELLLGLGPLGVARAGVEDGVGNGVEIVGAGFAADGEAREVLPGLLHPVISKVAKQISASLRTLREV